MINVNKYYDFPLQVHIREYLVINYPIAKFEVYQLLMKKKWPVLEALLKKCPIYEFKEICEIYIIFDQ